MAPSKYTSAKCGQCSYWKVSRNPLGKCRLDPGYQATIGRYARACGSFEAELVIQLVHIARKCPLIYYKRP